MPRIAEWEVGLQDRKWQQNKANYYFPKIDRYPDLKTATLVFVASSLGLIVLISALIILLYRVGARARQQRELQSRLRTISELLGVYICIIYQLMKVYYVCCYLFVYM